jgi:transcriptional regulator with AAA-type ATPase domain/tetratricopeptide (TPR) repeat protein
VQGFDTLIGESPSMLALRGMVRRFLERQREARRIPSVLLLGETGTGKGLLAKLLHRGSPRADAPFVEVNCAAIPDTLLEAELFGFARGAFTDARQAKAGLFQAAHHGTIFLDEIALLNEGAQGKLLKVLEDRAVRRLGSTRSEPIDVWIIAATSEELLAKTRDGGFREDLYHRLAVVTLTLPPLRERGADVSLLADTLLKAACTDYGLPPKSLGPEARRALARHTWPGNVRELGNAMERLALLCESAVVGPEHLDLPTAAAPRANTPVDLSRPVEERRRDELLAVLMQTNWNITRAAAQLLITRNTLRARMQRYGLRDHGAVPNRAAGRGPASPAAGARPTPPDWRTGHPGVVWEARRLTLLRAEIAAPYGDTLSRRVGHAFETVVDKVRSFGGRVEEVTPAAVMAVFGLDPVDEAPRRATNAALAIQRAQRGDVPDGPAVSLALHVAELLVARIGGDLAIDTHSKREVWSVLDSLNSQARPDGICASVAAAPLLRRRFTLVPAEGLDSRVGAAHRVVGPEHPGLALDEASAPFTGRHYEVDVLRRRLASSLAGESQIVSLAGEPGIGKSRLLHEFRDMLDGQARMLMAECLAHGRGFPYLPIIGLLTSVLGVSEDDDPRVVRDTVSRQFASFSSPSANDGVGAVLGLLRCLPDDDPLFSLTPAQRRRRTLEAVHQVLVAKAEQHPLVVVIEDLQWIDAESEAMLSDLVDRIAHTRILLLASYRPEYKPTWKRQGHVTELALAPLPPASVHAVLESLLGPDPRLANLKELIVRRTEGNPFFVEETVRTLIEARILAGSRGSFELTEVVDAVEVPPTVQAVLAARIDRLDLEERRLLQAAAVIGRTVPLNLLGALVDMPDAERDSRLAALQRANFLYELRKAPEPTRMFTHEVTCEVARASLLPEERRRLHGSLVSAFESARSGDEFLDHIDTVSHHAYEAQIWDKASRYSRQAAERAMTRAAYRAAVFSFERAVAASDKLAPTQEVLRFAVDVRFELRNALWALGELSRGLQHLRDAAPLVEALGDERRLARLCARTSFNALILGDNDGALEAGERALALATTTGDEAVRVDAHQYLGVLHNSLGNYRRAVDYLDSNLQALPDGRHQGRFADYYAVHSRAWLVWSLCELGELERAIGLAEESRDIADASKQPYNIVASRWALGLFYLAEGQPGLAIPELQRAFAVCQAAEVAIWLRPSVALFGRALALAGRLGEGLPLLEQAMRPDENHVGVSAWETYLAEAYTLAGRLEEAAAHAWHAADLARERHEVGFLAHAHHQLARIAERRRAAGEAREHHGHALRLARERGMRPLLAACEQALERLGVTAGP